MTSPSEQLILTIPVIGGQAVGKWQYVLTKNGNMQPQDENTVQLFNASLHSIKWQKRADVKAVLLTVSNRLKDLPQLTNRLLENADGCLLVFDLTRYQSLHEAIEWKARVDESSTQENAQPIPCLLVGNKCEDTDKREVLHSYIQDMCRMHGFFDYREMSVKEGIMVQESLEILVEKIMTDRMTSAINAEETVTEEESDDESKSRSCAVQ